MIAPKPCINSASVFSRIPWSVKSRHARTLSAVSPSAAARELRSDSTASQIAASCAASLVRGAALVTLSLIGKAAALVLGGCAAALGRKGGICAAS